MPVRNSRAFKRDAYPEDLLGALVEELSSGDFMLLQLDARKLVVNFDQMRMRDRLRLINLWRFLTLSLSLERPRVIAMDA